MSTVTNFYGKDCIEPGAYAATVYNPVSVTNVAAFGNVMLIDTGLSKLGSLEFAGGSGIKGELNSGLKSVYEFTSYEDFLAFMGGGLVADIVKKIFTPLDGAKGAPKVYYTRAATTTCASIVLTMSEGNSLTFKCKNEGIVGNGVASNGVLKNGYAAKIIAGTTEGKFILQVSKGTFAGLDKDGETFGTKTLEAALPIVVSESPELSTLDELYAWTSTDKRILSNFIVSKTGAGATALVAISQTLATGGTTVFLENGEYKEVLEAIPELDITFFLSTTLNIADGLKSDTNGQLFTYLKQDAKFDEFLVIPGGSDSDDLFGTSGSTESIAKYYNSSKVVAIHGCPEIPRKDGNGIKTLYPIYLAASVIGLNAGLEPQTPITFKNIGYQSFVYPLKKKEREKALQAGIMHVRNVSGTWRINQGITTLLENKRTIADDGQSFELSVELIKAQINKELILDAEIRFTGGNVAQASPETVKNFTETKLKSFVAEKGNDNLIISWKNVKVTALNGDYKITYEFVPNVPVNKTFFVGNVLDFSL